MIKKYKLELNVQLFAFCFLPQKVYLILQPRQFKDASAFLRLANQSYAMYFNTRYGCRGPLWNGGCKTTVIHNDQILIDCIRWIEEVPVKLNLSFSPVSYPWSSCSYRIAEQKSGLLDTRTQHKTIR